MCITNEIAKKFATDAEYRKSIKENSRQILADLNMVEADKKVEVFQNTDTVFYYILGEKFNRVFDDHELEDIVSGTFTGKFIPTEEEWRQATIRRNAFLESHHEVDPNKFSLFSFVEHIY